MSQNLKNGYLGSSKAPGDLDFSQQARELLRCSLCHSLLSSSPQMAAIPALLLLGSLFLCSHAETSTGIIDALKAAALQWEGPITCDDWDCNCTFTRQRSCCCAANEMYQLEDQTYGRVKGLWYDIMTLYHRVKALSESTKIAFKATMNSAIASVQPDLEVKCFGPFNINVPLPFSEVTLNDGFGYNPTLGIFTAPKSGIYVFSFTIYSYVGESERLYHKVILMRNGEQAVSVWENNREDGEDSASQIVILRLVQGDQVYLDLLSGRKICRHLEYNIFTGYMLYPDMEEAPFYAD
ncbi:cerebellin 18 [Salarias fasciatus]|uniref:cerebellin 18 n=1 Tax=Salarias fasciatus TaxID=181472 RepID=UPI0011769C57|nr:uncharacterized protein LOC115400022 [Salarias fasciatus]